MRGRLRLQRGSRLRHKPAACAYRAQYHEFARFRPSGWLLFSSSRGIGFALVVMTAVAAVAAFDAVGSILVIVMLYAPRYGALTRRRARASQHEHLSEV